MEDLLEDVLNNDLRPAENKRTPGQEKVLD